MFNKSFLLSVDQDKLKLLDLYCKQQGIFRTDFFRKLLDSWIKDNKENVTHVLKQINRNSFIL